MKNDNSTKQSNASKPMLGVVFSSKKLTRRYAYLISKIGYNPIDYGFEFDWFVNGRSISFSKKLEDRTILLEINYWFGKVWMGIYKNTYCTNLFKFEKTFPDKRNFERILKVSEKHKRIGVPGYRYKNERGTYSFQYDENYA